MFRTSKVLMVAMVSNFLLMLDPVGADDRGGFVESATGDAVEEALFEGAFDRSHLIARVKSADGGEVEWLVGEDGEVGIGIAAVYPAKPMVAAAFLERHDPVEVFLAVAPVEREVPAELLAFMPVDADLPDMSPEARRQLRQKNQVALLRVPAIAAEAPEKATGCSASFKSWVGSVYGDSTCGSLGVGSVHLATTTSTDYYCNGSPDCDYPLSKETACSPALQTCDVVSGTTFNRRQRFSNSKGNLWMAYWGRKQHYGAANCSGNGAFTFGRQRGSSTTSRKVGVNTMYHYYWGRWHLPVIAADSAAHGAWQNGRPASGPDYKYNKAWLASNAGSGDRAILCGDIKIRYSMADRSPSSCHGSSVRLCTGSNCTTNCFHCSGGC